jgi:clan AA aspartic protease (TIGR02281 family)
MKKALTIILLFLIQMVYSQESGCSGDCENGDGIWIDNNGNRYEGNWENGKRYGEFTYFYKDGDKFVGMVINDTIHGQGVFETINNKLSGQLKQVYTKNNTYSIILVGKGVKYSKKHKYTYTGNFKNNLLNGKGEINYDGTIYKGYFVDDKIEGKGVVYYKGGDRWEGDFKNDEKNGYGIQYTSKGGELRGRWLNGVFIDGSDSNLTNDIPLIPNGDGAYSIEVNFEGQLTISMIFDTGADIVLLKRENFASLLAEGKIKEIINKDASFTDASGGKNSAIIYVIAKIKIGPYTINDVICAVNPGASNAPNLLGMSAIRKLGNSVEINFQKNSLEVRE